MYFFGNIPLDSTKTVKVVYKDEIVFIDHRSSHLPSFTSLCIAC